MAKPIYFNSSIIAQGFAFQYLVAIFSPDKIVNYKADLTLLGSG